VHLAFDIFQGIGIAVAIGIRPFLPSLAGGVLAGAGLELRFDHTSYAFLQSLPFLLVMVLAAALLVVLDRGVWASRLRSGPLAAALGVVSLGLGGLFFAGSLVRDHHAAWPGWLAGVACAALGLAATRPFLKRVRARLDDAAAAVGLPLIGDGLALLTCVLSILAPPVGVAALAWVAWLLYRGRQGGQQKYAGLRVLR
jgi:hypothetical protein